MCFEPTTENIGSYQEGWSDAKTDSEKIIDALRKARRYIRTVEAWRQLGVVKQLLLNNTLAETIDSWTDGNEIKAIEDALSEMGVIV